MIYVSDVQKAAAAYAQDLKENSVEYGFASGYPRNVRCTYSMQDPMEDVRAVMSPYMV